MTKPSHARLCVLVAGIACALPALAEPPPFAGRWLLDERQGPPSAQAPYTNLDIKSDSLTWGGAKKSAPTCTRAYTLKPEPRGTQYTNARGTKFIAGFPGSLPTYLLVLGAGDCGSAADAVRLIYPLVYDTRHIEVIEYAKGKAVGVHRLHRRK